MYANTIPVHGNVHLPTLDAITDFAAGLIYGFTGHNHLAEI